MNLLYCRDDIVLGWHDSMQAAVPASNYGDGVRIIPYPNPLTTLMRVGEVVPLAQDRPVNPAVVADSRPYGEPPETPELLKGFAGQVRFDMVTAGIVWNAIPIKTDRISQGLINNLATYAASIDPNTVINFTQDSIVYQIIARDVADLNVKVNAFVQECRNTEADCLTDLNSASPTITTYEHVESRFAGLRTQTLLEWNK